MGILNLTPDSFFDGGRYKDIDVILRHVESMIEEGADFIDIGASSTRPGALPVSVEEEIERLIEPVKQIRNSFPEIFVSIDTYHSKVAQRMVWDFGVDIINDISAGSLDEAMFEMMSNLNVPYIIMHIQGTPEGMQKNPSYKELVKEVMKYLADRINQLNLLGVNDIIADPGFGFGKTLNQNYELLADLDVFSLLDVPLLVGLSRKSMIYKLLKNTPEESLNGTSIVHTMALINGANILRVHDIKQAKETISLVSKLSEFSKPGIRG
ncbi:MAG: dihydropteroate synthase [Bacteroidales bacterium]|nr:dihydropteroate synthase [Bacteroidales bacterium]